MSEKANVNLVESDSVALVRRKRVGDRDRDSLAWIPVFLRQPDNEPFVKWNGDWCAVSDLPGFERYEKVRPRKRKLYDTARNMMVEG